MTATTITGIETVTFDSLPRNALFKIPDGLATWRKNSPSTACFGVSSGHFTPDFRVIPVQRVTTTPDGSVQVPVVTAPKPHIKLSLGNKSIYACYRPDRPFGPMGFGRTPLQAYRDYLRRRKARLK